MSKLYYPSNSTEGMMFDLNNCELCYKEKQCTIKTNALIGKQPKQWIYDDKDNPICTSLQKYRPKQKEKVKQDNSPNLFQ